MVSENVEIYILRRARANVIICCNRLQEPYASVMIAEYEQRYGSKPNQSLLPLQYVPVSGARGIQ